MSDTGNDQPGSPDGINSRWAELPRHIRQPFALGATCLVIAIPLAAISTAAALVAIGVGGFVAVLTTARTPRSALGQLVSGKPVYRALDNADRSRPLAEVGSTSSLSDLEKVAALHMYHREGGAKFGLQGQFRVEYFVDLMEAALVPDHLAILVKELVAFIRSNCDLRNIQLAISPKRGNAVLCYRVASELNLKPVFVKQASLFGRDVEGLASRGDRALLIDDVSSDGELLTDVVGKARGLGIEVEHAFVLVDRTEGDASARLREVGVQLSAARQLDDAGLARLSNSLRSGAA